MTRPRLAQDFPNLDLEDQDGKAGVDTVTMSFLAAGKDGAGADVFRARQLLLQGEELFAPPQQPQWPLRAERHHALLEPGPLRGHRHVARLRRAARALHTRWRSPARRATCGSSRRRTSRCCSRSSTPAASTSGCWVFAAGLTSVETEIRVRDTLTGNVQVYTNVARRDAFAPLQDTSAFPTCGAPPAPASAAVSDAAWIDAPASRRVRSAHRPFPVAAAPAWCAERTLRTRELGRATGSCTASATTLCLLGGRFRVRARWTHR